MSDTLRTRIAAVIRREVPCHPPAADRIAGAVIRELNLDISHYYKTSQGREVCIEGFWTEEATDGTA